MNRRSVMKDDSPRSDICNAASAILHYRIFEMTSVWNRDLDVDRDVVRRVLSAPARCN